MTPETISALIQVPLVLAFIVFTLEMLKRFNTWQEGRDKFWHDFMETSEKNNKDFLREQRDAYGQMVGQVVSAIGTLAEKQAEHTAMLMEHDRNLLEHDRKLDAFIQEAKLRQKNE